MLLEEASSDAEHFTPHHEQIWNGEAEDLHPPLLRELNIYDLNINISMLLPK